ncbi:uncharacterized protein LOC134096179 [Sardina pilchardus]|uniref:uncharacterized protein LOC134096179 n=1 Tax=Sardina pilchardus TaxID=27697 RepID=UPI002E0E81B3
MSEGTFNLTIRNITSSDVATYYCTDSMNRDITFGDGTFLALTEQYNCSFNGSSAFFRAVANCGQINCHNKTDVIKENSMNLVVFGLVVVLGLCCVLISYLIYLIYHYKKHRNDRVEFQQGHPARSSRDPSSGQDADGLINYAALHFSDKKMKRGKQKRDLPRESVYSDDTLRTDTGYPYPAAFIKLSSDAHLTLRQERKNNDRPMRTAQHDDNFHDYFDMAHTEVPQQSGPITKAHIDGNVTLECFFSGRLKSNRFYWFKQTLGDKPSVLVQSQEHGETVFSEGFNNGRFKLDKGGTYFHLLIENVNRSEEGMYFCGMRVSYDIVFGNGTFLAIEGEQWSATDRVVQAPVPDPVYQGDSVILQCTVINEKQTEYRVLWFRRSAGDSQPGLIYSPINRSRVCEDHCVYRLPKSNLTLSDSGVYYCVVDICGRVIFGNGTVLEIRSLALFNTVVSLGAILGLCICLVLYLVWLTYKGKCAQAAEPVETPLNHFENQGGVADATVVNYTALHFSERKPKAGRKRETSTHSSVYSDVRHHAQQAF